jgi:hypothetical protein
MKKTLYSILMLMGAAIASVAVASILLAPPKEDKPILETKCLLIMVASNRSSILKETFIADLDNSIHRASSRSFAKDEYQIDVVANEGWMGLSWRKGARELGSSLTNVESEAGRHRVLLIRNPENPADQLSLSCSL